MARWLLTCLMTLSILACSVVAKQREVFNLVAVQMGPHKVAVQLADTPEKRAQGLMFQSSADPGMLLLYPQPTVIALWMANTAIPLDVAYIGPDWTVLQLITLEPYDETPVPSPAAVIAALEMPRGWFAKHGIIVGQKVNVELNTGP
jgi:uncharacterized protein